MDIWDYYGLDVFPKGLCVIGWYPTHGTIQRWWKHLEIRANWRHSSGREQEF
jgi:hypothetical protein